MTRYFFKAQYADGHEFTDDVDGASKIAPPDENGAGLSSFHDVLAYPSELVTFSLMPENQPAKVCVHLTTGLVLVDGLAVQSLVFIGDLQNETLKRELVWAKIVQQPLNLSVATNTGDVLDRQLGNRILVGFQIGWRTLINGVPVTHALQVEA